MFTSTIALISLIGSAYAAPAPAAATSDAASDAASESQNGGQFDGTATYYYQNGNPGSCGDWHSDNDWIVAVNAPQQDGSCGNKVIITNTKNGNTAIALAADTCPGCDYGSLDLSSGLFSYLGDGDYDQGVFPIKWDWVN